MTIFPYSDEGYVTVLGKKLGVSQETKPASKLTLFAFGAALGLCKIYIYYYVNAFFYYYVYSFCTSSD